jgi:hypothetical protein
MARSGVFIGGFALEDGGDVRGIGNGGGEVGEDE